MSKSFDMTPDEWRFTAIGLASMVNEIVQMVGLDPTAFTPQEIAEVQRIVDGISERAISMGAVAKDRQASLMLLRLLRRLNDYEPVNVDERESADAS